MTEPLITDWKQWQAALEHAVTLARAGEIDSAQAQVDVMNRWAARVQSPVSRPGR